VWSIENRVEKLVEIRIWSPVSVAETVAWAVEHERVIASVRGRYVCFVDLVDATVFPPECVDAYVATMRDEPRLLRTGTLLNPSPTFGMQIQRMIRDAGNPDRRVFRDPLELESWLGAVLTIPERARLRSLVALRG
jgi:hypothetical protein